MVQALKKEKEKYDPKEGCSLDDMIAKLSVGSEWERALVTILVDTRFVSCKFCGGVGHHVKECSSMKAVDKAVKGLPSIRKVWGAVKKSKRGSGADAGQARAALQFIDTNAANALAVAKTAVGGAEAGGFKKFN